LQSGTPGFGPTRTTLAAELIANAIIEKAQRQLAEENRRLLAAEIKRQGVLEHLAVHPDQGALLNVRLFIMPGDRLLGMEKVFFSSLRVYYGRTEAEAEAIRQRATELRPAPTGGLLQQEVFTWQAPARQ